MNIDKDNEWLAQERALQDERTGANATNDPLVARYRVIARALRQPLPEALPVDFAQALAAKVQHAPLDTRVEQGLMRALVTLLALSGAVAAALYGQSWWPAIAALLPLSSGVAVNWALALAACVGASWLVEQVRRTSAAHHA
jgi:hypothetical protein